MSAAPKKAAGGRKPDGAKPPSKTPSVTSEASSKASKNKADGIDRVRKSDIDGRDKEATSGRKGAKAEAKVSPDGTTYAGMVKLKDVALDEQGPLFCKKLQECAIVHNWRDPEGQLPEKEGKRQTLVELIELANDRKPSILLDETVLAELVRMAGINLFRTLTKKERLPIDMVDADEEDPAFDPAWPHLELIYELLQRTVSSKEIDPLILCKYFSMPFVTKILDLFDSDDPRERDCLKTLIKRMQEKLSSLRSNIRKAIQNRLQLATVDGAVMNGVPELLEAYSRFVHSFSSPLKDEHRECFRRIVLPLHKVEWLAVFHPQLLDCTKKFTDKEQALAFEVVESLLRYWPSRISGKQVLFLSEMDDMLSIMPQNMVSRLQPRLAKVLCECLTFPNSDIAEKALAMWKSDKFVKAVMASGKEQLPDIISSLYNNATQHWHQSVHVKTLEVLRLLLEKDPELFDSSSAKHRKACEEREKQDALREKRWRTLQALHDKKQLQVAAVPRLESPKGAPRSVGSPRGAGNSRLRTESNKSVPANRSPKYIGKLGTVKGVVLDQDRYGFGVTWEAESKGLHVAFEAVIMDSRGRLLDAVHEHNLVALGAVSLRGSDRLVVPSAGTEHSGVVWVHLSQLPTTAMVLCFVMCIRGGSLQDIDQCKTHAVAEKRDKEVANASVEFLGGTAAVVAVLRRVSGSQWSLSWVHEVSKAARNFMDMLEPTLGKVLRDVNPSIPKKQKLSVSFTRMLEGSVACLPSPGSVKFFFVGISWDLVRTTSEKADVSSEEAGLAFSLVYFSSDGQSLGTVELAKPEGFGARHSGKGLLDQGCMLDLGAVPKTVDQIFVVGTVLSKQVPNLESVRKPICCVVDSLGSELVRFAASIPEGRQADSRGFIAARLLRLEENLGEGPRWVFQALGFPVAGDSCEELVPDLQQVFAKPIAAYQSLPCTVPELGVPCVISL